MIDSVDPLLAVGLTVLCIILLIINIYVLVHWSHPQDRSESYLLKGLLLLCLQLISVSVLLIPIDVANNSGSLRCDPNSPLANYRSYTGGSDGTAVVYDQNGYLVPGEYYGEHGNGGTYCGGLDIPSVWSAFFVSLAVIVVCFLPFATLYYEADDGSLFSNDGKATKSRFCEALTYEFVVICMATALICGLYFTKADAEMPVSERRFHLNAMEYVDYKRGVWKVTETTASPTMTPSMTPTLEPTLVENVRRLDLSEGAIFGNSNSHKGQFNMNWEDYRVAQITDDDDLSIPTSSPTSVGQWVYPRNQASFLEMELPLSEFHSEMIVEEETIWRMPVGFDVYLIGLFGWIGWWIFSLFVGTGLAATPVDWITAFIYRPTVLPPDQMAAAEMEVKERTADLLELASLMKKERESAFISRNTSSSNNSFLSKVRGGGGDAVKRRVQDRMEVNKLAQMVFVLEEDLAKLRAIHVLRESYNPLIPYMHLMMGIVFAALSFLWFLQLILAVLASPPITPFLSLYLTWFDGWFPMFGTVSYALLAFYLLLATIRGCFKLSVRLFCFRIYPMRPGATFINAFIFNVGIIMLCTIPLIHLCVRALGSYIVDTDVYFLLAVKVESLHFFRTFFIQKVFIYMIVVISGLLACWLSFRPRDKPNSTEDFRRELSERVSKTNSTPITYSAVKS